MVENRHRRAFYYIQQFRNAARERGIPTTLHDAFGQANIMVTLEGNIEPLKNTKQGVLLIGDHRKALEPALVTGALGQVGRNDIHFLGLPYALPKSIADYVGATESELLLPVLPGYLIKNKPGSEGKKSREKKRKVKLKHRLARAVHGRDLSEEERIQTNTDSLARASALLTKGDAVTIFPTGGGSDIYSHWRDGAANILLGIPTDKRKDILIAFFSCDDGFSPKQLVTSVVKRAFGIRPKAREFTIKFGDQPKTAFDLIGNETDPAIITELLKVDYLASLHPKPRRGFKAS